MEILFSLYNNNIKIYYYNILLSKICFLQKLTIDILVRAYVIFKIDKRKFLYYCIFDEYNYYLIFFFSSKLI